MLLLNEDDLEVVFLFPFAQFTTSTNYTMVGELCFLAAFQFERALYKGWTFYLNAQFHWFSLQKSYLSNISRIIIVKKIKHKAVRESNIITVKLTLSLL